MRNSGHHMTTARTSTVTFKNCSHASRRSFPFAQILEHIPRLGVATVPPISTAMMFLMLISPVTLK